MPTLTIGKLAKAAHVHMETIRYYQKLGLLKVPERVDGKIRQYYQSDLDRLRFIRHAKQLGFSLKDIAQLLSLDEKSCHKARTIAKQTHGAIQAKITDLQHFSTMLNNLIDQCEADNSPNCPIIETLQSPKA